MRLPIQSLTRATLWVGVFGISRAVLSQVVRSLAASRFGVGSDVDAYVAALRLPQLIGDFLVGGTLYYVVIPCLQEVRQRHGEGAAWGLARAVLGRTTVLLVALSLGYFFLADAAVGFVAPNLPQTAFALATHMSRVLCPMFLLMGLILIQSGIIQSRRHFLATAAGGLLPQICVLASLWLLGPSIGVPAWAWGMVVGTALQVLVLLVLLLSTGMRATDERPPPEFMRRMVRLIIGSAIAMTLGRVHDVVQTRLASGVVGGLTNLNFGGGLVMLAYGLAIAPLMTAIFPLLSQHAAERQWKLLRDTAALGIRVGFFVTVPAVVCACLFGRDAIAVLFQRGRFGGSDTRTLHIVFALFSVNLLASLLLDMVSRVVYGMLDIRTALKMGVVRVVASLAINYGLFVGWSLYGLALAVALVNAVDAAAGAFFLSRRGIVLFGVEDVHALSRILLPGLMALAAGYCAQVALQPLPYALLRLGVGVAAAMGVYLGACAFLKSPELALVMNRVSRIRR